MAKQTQSTAPTAPSDSLALEDLYNVLMEEIDSDLTTYNIESLDEIYAGESEEDKKDRATRYVQSFEIFHRVFDGLAHKLGFDLKTVRKNFLKGMEEKALSEDAKQLEDIEDSLSDS